MVLLSAYVSKIPLKCVGKTNSERALEREIEPKRRVNENSCLKTGSTYYNFKQLCIKLETDKCWKLRNNNNGRVIT